MSGRAGVERDGCGREGTAGVLALRGRMPQS